MRDGGSVRAHVPGGQGGTAPAAARGLPRAPGPGLAQLRARARRRIASPGCRRPRSRGACAAALAARPEPADGNPPVVTGRAGPAEPPARPGRETGT